MDKRKAALAALDNHARRYKVTIPARLRAFYAGDFARHHMHYVEADVFSWSNGVFRLALTPPTWLNKGDDAVNGPTGDWEDAKHYVPLFVTDQELYVVANLETPECPIGWYHEEETMAGDGEIDDQAPSLDAFLASLSPQPPNSDDDDEPVEPSDPDQEHDWAEDFADDGPRAFDVMRD